MRPGKTRNHLLAALVMLTAAAPAAALAADPAVEALELYRAGKCVQAEPLLRDVLSKQPKNTVVRKMLAGCLVQLHRPEEATLEYRQILKTAPGDPEAIRALQPPPPPPQPQQRAALPRPQPPEAMERAHAGTALESAEKLIAAGRLEEAEPVLTALVSRSPE